MPKYSGMGKQLYEDEKEHYDKLAFLLELARNNEELQLALMAEKPSPSKELIDTLWEKYRPRTF